MKYVFYFLFLLTIGLKAQELPPIENYTSVDYNAQIQNWGVSQSKQKNVYVANTGGLLEFNGATWQFYPSPNGSTIRSVKAINDIVFTGSYREFGFWKKNNVGDLIYTSISKDLTFPILENEDFWNIETLDEWVLFQSLERIYVYNTITKSIKTVEAKSANANMFNFQGTIYFHKTGKGLFKIKNGKSVLVSNNEIVKNSVVVGIFSIDNKALIVTEKGGFFFLEKENLIPWFNSLNQSIEPLHVFCSLQLADESIVLGTISNGIYHLAKDGSILQRINHEKGLNNNTVLALFEDIDQNLWLALDNGISVINMKSPFNEYIERNGKLGQVYASIIFNNNLYLGTNQGLFYKPTNTNTDFTLINGTEGQVWLLKEINNTLFCGHNRGTFIVGNDKVELVSDFPGTWDLKPIPNKTNLLLQGNFKGLSILENNAGKWSLRNTIDGFTISSRFFEFIGENKIAVNRELKGIFKLKINADFTKVTNIENEDSKGSGASIVSYMNNVLYTCSNGVFKYDRQSNTFVRDSVYNAKFYGNRDNPIGIFIPDEKSQRLWYFTKNNLVFASPEKLDQNIQINKLAIPAKVRNNLGVLGFESLTPIGDDTCLIGVTNGYITVRLNKLVRKEYTVAINSIAKKSKDFALEKVSKDTTAIYDFSENNILFSYNVPEYDKYKEVNYQYQLKGMYDDWSDWTTSSNASFENLPFGNYVFKVRAKIGDHYSSNIDAYKFRVKRPWYISNLMIAIYVLGILAFSLFMHMVYKRYYKKQQLKLIASNKQELELAKVQSEKEIVKIKNEQLEIENKGKSKELAASTMSIIRKNELLTSIKNKLSEAENKQGINEVIKAIDKNLKRNDDWEMFKEAFNNADNKFLKNLKKIHPSLSPNDLKLCAYLRLNLSSKEIAKLLNISPKGVEIKRYRLRKKLNLKHEINLVTYILEI